MNRKGPYNDKEMTHLLARYKPVVPSPSLVKILSEKMDFGGAIKKQRPRVLVPAASGIVALAAVLVMMIWPWKGELPFQEFRSGNWQTPQELTWKELPQDTQFRSEGQEITLSKGSSLEVLPLVGATVPGRTYRLNQGNLTLNHFNSRTTFKIETPLGLVEPVGTRLRVSVNPQVVDIHCDEGTLAVTDLDGVRTLVTTGKSFQLTTRPTPVAAAPSQSQAGPPIPQLPAWKSLWSAALDSPVRQVLGGTNQVFLVNQPGIRSFDLTTGKAGIVIPVANQQVSYSDGKLGVYNQGRLSMFSALSGQSLWETDSAPLSFNGFLMDQGRIYLASADGNLYIRAISTGEVLSVFPLGTGSYGTPIRHSGRIWVSTLDKKFLSLDESTGKVMTTVDLPGRLLGDTPFVLGRSLVTLDREGRAYGFDLNTGTLAWQTSTGKITGSPFVLGSFLALPASGEVRLLTSRGQIVPQENHLPLVKTLTALQIRDKIYIVTDGELSAWHFSGGIGP